MFRFWGERSLSAEYAPLLEGKAEFIGAASETPKTPWAALDPANAVLAGGRLLYDAEFMARTPGLKVIARTGIGYDNVDLAAATRNGVVACNTPDGPTRATAEHAIALLFCVAKEVRRNQNDIERGEEKEYLTASRAVEVMGKTLGLIGLGRIGGTVAQLANGLGMSVVAFDPFITEEAVARIGAKLLPNVEDVLQNADFVSIHVPLTPDSRHLINAERLAQMKKGSFLINCARGGVVDESALADALDSGHLAGAGLDVFSVEPPPPDHPLLNRDNVVATPHVAGGSIEGKNRIYSTAILQCLDVLEGRRPPHVLNPDVYEQSG